MSSHQRKRPGGAVDSGPAQKRSRLLPSSVAGTSQTEPIELEQSGTAALEPAGAEFIDLPGEDVVDLTGKSSEPDVIIISDDESAVDREQSCQQPHVSSASENSAEPLARDDEEDISDSDDDWLRNNFDHPYWSDEDSEDREQNEQQPDFSSASENSAEPLATDDEEVLSDFDEPWPAGRASPPSNGDDDSEDGEPQNFFRRTESSAERAARDAEEELRDYQGWTDRGDLSRFWMHSYSDWWYLRRQPRFVRAEENSALLGMRNNEQEQRNTDAQPAGPASPPPSEDEDSEDREQNEQQPDFSSASENSAESLSRDDEEDLSDFDDSLPSSAQQGVVIMCPICLDSYSEIVQSGRQLVATTCGHVFCSECLPAALDTTPMCPTCRVYLFPDEYHPIYL